MKIADTSIGQKELEAFEEKRTPWYSIWLCFVLQLLTGIQFSIFITSMWPYLKTLEPDANLNFFGWIMAVFSLGQMASSWLFGYWNQKTMSARYPALCGLFFTTSGNLLYALLPCFNNHQRWFMFVARLLVGFGSGNLCVLRGYCSMASNKKDLPRVMPLAVGSYVLGLSVGPAVQSAFIPLGKGATVHTLFLTMYTAPAFLMVITSIISIVVLLFFFKEEYAGLINEDENRDPYLVVPKFDKLAAFICIYLYFVLQTVTTSIETLSTPWTISLYNWTEKQAIFYNGIVQFIGSGLDIFNYLFITFTKVGKLDKRAMLIFSSLCYITYHVFTLPLPFYKGPLDYIKLAPNSTVEDTSYSGGCFKSYTWCSHTTRVPLWIYIVGYTIVLSFAGPFTAAPLGIAYPEILGPRKQGKMQGLMEFAGSSARCIIPIIQSFLFDRSGYLWPTIMNLFITAFGLALLIFFYGRIVPLKLVLRAGVPVHYKSGVVSRL